MENIIIIIVGVLVLIAIPVVMRKISWNKLLKALDAGDYQTFYKVIDSLSCKLTFGAYERENMRLSAFMAENRKDDIENQFKLMMNMRIKSKQRVGIGTRGFYYYLEQGKIKKARDMIDYVKANGVESSYHDLELQYSILLKKESKYIDEVKEKIDKIWNGTDPLEGDKKMIVGTFQYLIGLQYSYKDDIKNMKEYFDLALINVAGTPYEDSIKEILKQKKVK